VFTPDNDGIDDTVTVRPTVKTSADVRISRWRLVFSRLMDSNENPSSNFLPVHTIQGRDKPPEQLTWDGRVDQETHRVSSDIRLAAVLYVTDNYGRRAASDRIFFRSGILVRPVKRGLIIDVSPIRFGFRRHKLRRRYQPVVKQVYEVLRRYPNRILVVEGHADYKGPAWFNYHLSKKRADVVAAYLRQLGVPKERVVAVSFGERLPETLERGRTALNRRVVFLLLEDRHALRTYRKFRRELKVRADIDSEMKGPEDAME